MSTEKAAPLPSPRTKPAEEETKAEVWIVCNVEERQALPKGSVIRSLTAGLVEERWGDGSWRVSGHPAVLDGSKPSAFPCEVLYPRSRHVSSPIVPGPTENGLWQTWQEVPEGVTVKAANGERFRKTGVGAIHLLTNGVGDCCKISPVTDLLAPFVAAEVDQ